MTTGREANVNSLRPSVCNFSEFPCPSNRGRFNLRLPLATVNQQLHCLAIELLVVSFLNLLFLHGFSLFTLSFRVRKIRGGSNLRSSMALLATNLNPRTAPVKICAIFAADSAFLLPLQFPRPRRSHSSTLACSRTLRTPRAQPIGTSSPLLHS